MGHGALPVARALTLRMTSSQTSKERLSHLPGFLEIPGPGDAERLAALVTASGELRLISGESGSVAEASLLQHWFTDAQGAVVFRADDSPIAMGTVTRSEAHHPADSIEVCHLFVAPRLRRRYRGSQVALELSSVARSLGYQRLVGRVVSTNVPALCFLSSLGWRPCSGPGPDDPSLVWLEKRLTRQ